MKLLVLISIATYGLYGQNACILPNISLKPLTPLGCTDTQEVCICRGNRCDWEWACTNKPLGSSRIDRPARRSGGIDTSIYNDINPSTPIKTPMELELQGRQIEKMRLENERLEEALRSQRRSGKEKEYTQQELNDWGKKLRESGPKAERATEIQEPGSKNCRLAATTFEYSSELLKVGMRLPFHVLLYGGKAEDRFTRSQSASTFLIELSESANAKGKEYANLCNKDLGVTDEEVKEYIERKKREANPKP